MKIGMYVLFSSPDQKHLIVGYIFLNSGDINEYLSPIDNLVEHGNYAISESEPPYAGRLPGFVFPYILFRCFVAQTPAIFCLGIFILLFSVYASVKLFQLISSFANSSKLAWLGVVCIQLIPYYWHWDWSIHPNSVAASCLILAIFHMHAFMRAGSKKHLFITGSFIMWMFMLRGVTILIIPSVVIFLIYYLYTNGNTISRSTALVFIFLAPLMIVEFFWVGRNFISLHKFIPLQTYFIPGGNNSRTEYAYGNNTKYSMMKVREMISCWGGDNFWYFKGTDMGWFVSEHIKVPAEQQFKKVVFVGDITPVKLQGLKQDIIYSLKQGLTQSQHDSIEAKIETSSQAYSSEFMKHNSSYYYFVAPFNRVKNFLFKNTTQDWPGLSFGQSGLLNKGIKGLSLAGYFITLLLFGIFSIVKFRTILRDKFLLFLFIFPVCMIITFAFFINAAHYCYFIYGYIPSTILLLYALRSKNTDQSFIHTNR